MIYGIYSVKTELLLCCVVHDNPQNEVLLRAFSVLNGMETISARIIQINGSLTEYNINVSFGETSTPIDLDKYVTDYLGEKRKELFSAVVLSVVYLLIFVTGIIGNLSTCLVIGKNAYMHSITNYYLLNLAVSDMLILVLGKYHNI